MYCHNCGEKIPDGTKFCRYCGAEQAAEDLSASPAAEPQAPASVPAEHQSSASARETLSGGAAELEDRQSPASVRSAPKPVKQNIVGGMIGALFGALMGVIGMTFLLETIPDRSGISLVVSGVAMAVYVFLNWRLFGRKLGNVGLVLCTLVTVIAVYLGLLLNFGIGVSAFSNPYYAPLRYVLVFGGVDSQNIAACILAAMDALLADPILMAFFARSLLTLFVSAVLGAIAIIVCTVKNRPREGQAKRKGGLIFLALLLLTVCIWGGSIALVSSNPDARNNGPIHSAIAAYVDRELVRIEEQIPSFFK